MDREKPARFISLAEAFPKLLVSKVFLGFSLRTHAWRSTGKENFMELFGVLSTSVWIAIASLTTFAILISFIVLKKKK